MRLFQVPKLGFICYVIILVSISLFSTAAGAVITSFFSPWDPTNPLDGFSLRATQPGSSATITSNTDQSAVNIELILNNCRNGCGAFYLDNSSNRLPYGFVQFDWTLVMNDYSSDGQIAIDGVDPSYNSGFRNSELYPFVLSGTANINYRGGTFTFFNVGIGAVWNGSTTATIFLSNFTGPSAAALSSGTSSNSTNNVGEPAGWALLLLGGAVIYRLRRRRTGQLVGGPQRFQITGWAAPS